MLSLSNQHIIHWITPLAYLPTSSPDRLQSGNVHIVKAVYEYTHLAIGRYRNASFIFVSSPNKPFYFIIGFFINSILFIKQLNKVQLQLLLIITQLIFTFHLTPHLLHLKVCGMLTWTFLRCNSKYIFCKIKTFSIIIYRFINYLLHFAKPNLCSYS